MKYSNDKPLTAMMDNVLASKLGKDKKQINLFSPEGFFILWNGELTQLTPQVAICWFNVGLSAANIKEERR